MKAEKVLEQAKGYQQELILHRRFLHQHAETGFALQQTTAYVCRQLEEMGYAPEKCGRAGLVATVGGKQPGKTFLLRADMDALPIREQTHLEYACQDGRMHACGHDMHTSMLLGAAKLLKDWEDELHGTVKLMFQPAEEIFEGSRDMIQEGVLKNPDVDAALMIHVMAGMPFPAGNIIVCDGGVSTPAADFFTITLQGKGCHGSMPQNGVDPITAAAHIITALQEIHARELSLHEPVVLTIGSIHAGSAPNVIPDQAELTGSLRSFDEKVRARMKQRVEEIAVGTAAVFRAKASVKFGSGCPTLFNDGKLSECVSGYARELLGADKAFTQSQLAEMSGESVKQSAGGSEDFAYVSHEVPSIMLALMAGDPERGYCYPQHHPQVIFDEAVLSEGSAVYAYLAARWLEEHV